nr:MAG TPA: accessory secretory protein [Caudoviricetes sp.]
MSKKGNKKVDKDKISAVISVVIGIVILLLAIVALAGVEIYVWVTYSDTPASELPAWVLFWMFGGKK